MIDPVGIWGKDNTIVEGHGRVLACKQLGIDKVPCIRLDHLTDEQRREYAIVHNKSQELALYDFDNFADELADLDFSDFNFDFGIDTDTDDDAEIVEDEEDGEDIIENARQRTFEKYNLEMFDETEAEGKYQMPKIKGVDFVPDDLIGFNYALNSTNKKTGIHCFIDDYQFERLWNNPFNYVDAIGEYQCFLTPDFSLYTEMPLAMKIWNVYRSRLIGQIYQDQDITVIPTVSWAEKETFEFCFDGLPKNSTVAISTIGVKSSNEAMQIWKNGVEEMEKRLTPKTILVYGGKVEHNYKCKNIIYFENKVTEALNNGR